MEEEKKYPQVDDPNKDIESSNNEEQVNDKGVVDLYEYGFTNGLLKIDPDFFDLWVEAFDREKLYDRKLLDLKRQKEGIRARLIQTEQKRELLEEAVVSNDRLGQETKRKIDQLDERMVLQQEKEEALEQAIEDSTPHYKAASVTLFLFGGLVFILADVLFSQNVLTNVLDMPGWEAWILAIAVGAMTFAIKPAVDRVFEQPFIKGENKRRNHAFLIVVSLLILTALGVLGAFRNQAQFFLKERAYLQDKISTIEDARAHGETDIDDARFEGYKDEILELDRKLYLDWRVQTGFVLISILFAVAGAICFSIGLPAGSQLIVRQKHRRMLKGMLASLELMKKEYDSLYDQLAEHEIAAKTSRQQLEHLPDPEDLRAAEKVLIDKELLLQEERTAYRAQRHKTWYKLGYLRGEKYSLSDKLVVHPYTLGTMFDKTNDFRRRKGGQKKYTSTKKPLRDSSPNRNVNYMHEQLREMIDYNFNKQQNLNGTHED
ncbi:MAG: hypothetical protein ACE362_26210 [Phaeodactylibacter xiamenensis]|uniref:Uncharacterized protein n=1 Tax=Phaeodactylibacter xiamenensis TaxID=1524460 RepID=A0A098S6L5_9BACT|nr:hypothetical protein [Phaeodactylibacter xiamenensis]KGE88064.1 hypothetical protein IX84_11280 [Phaeodactylibacter xiamenensis]MCR9054174.1 hypothetical protein [bacterium]